MDEVKNFLSLDFQSLIYDIFVVMIFLMFVLDLIGKFSKKLGIEIKWFKEKNTDHTLLAEVKELTDELKELRDKDNGERYKANTKIEEEIGTINTTLSEICARITDIETKSEMNEIATKEALCDRINQKYKHYISLKGIPEDEVEEFERLHSAYKGVGGNHTGDAKYKYCVEHLPIIPSCKTTATPSQNAQQLIQTNQIK